MLGDKRQRYWYLVAAAVLVVAAVGMALVVRHHRSMCTALMDLQAENQADTVFKSDSAALRLVRHFDSPACLLGTSNDRMLAHYLLGRAHADMDDAPAAIQDYYDAIECADTTDADCNIRILRNVYGQMAEVFHAQNLPEDEIEAQKQFIHYAWIMGDTIMAVDGYRMLENPYYLLGRYDSIMIVDSIARQKLLALGDTIHATATLIVPSYLHIINKDYDKAAKEIEIVKLQSGIFMSDGNLKRVHQGYYYTLGLYFDGIGLLDSAEYYFRKAVSSHKFEAGYQGLLSVYEKLGMSDSIAKYARLYADANDAMHRAMNSTTVHNTTALYNYSRHQRIAVIEARNAHRRLLIIYSFILVLLVFIVSGYAAYSQILRREKRREHMLNMYRKLYIDKKNTVDTLLKEHSDLLVEQERISHELDELRGFQEQYEFVISQMQAQSSIGLYYSDEVVQDVIDASIQRISVPDRRTLQRLQRRFEETFPHFVNSAETVISSNSYNIYVCILTDLGLSTGDIAFLLGLSSQQISNAKQRLNVKLFQGNGAISFYKNLRISIHSHA